jgi:hypothetical protein
MDKKVGCKGCGRTRSRKWVARVEEGGRGLLQNVAGKR